MKSWPAPFIPAIPGRGEILRLRDSSSGELVPIDPQRPARMYVCGITPYDATHLGHAATYVTFDIAQRVLRDAGHEVRYIQNVTDVDEPLLERAERDGVGWEDLATREIDLFREDMTALGVLPPDALVGVVESIDLIAEAVRALEASGAAYRLPVQGCEGEDIYLDLATQADFGTVSGWSREAMLDIFAERGGDPERPGKRDPLDPLLWRARRPGEPSWEAGGLGRGRPGWHIECTAIAVHYLGSTIDVQGGGTDLVFPHHEMSATQATAMTGDERFAHAFVHQAMVGLDGSKMSKSLGNLVLVSRLRTSGVDPMTIRVLLLAQRYGVEWDYTEDLLGAATSRVQRWRAALSAEGGAPWESTLAQVRARLADNLDTPRAVAAIDAWAEQTLAGDHSVNAAPGVLARMLDGLLGVRL